MPGSTRASGWRTEGAGLGRTAAGGQGRLRLGVGHRGRPGRRAAHRRGRRRARRGADQAARPVGRHLAPPEAQQGRPRGSRHHHRLPVRRDRGDGLLSGPMARASERRHQGQPEPARLPCALRPQRGQLRVVAPRHRFSAVVDSSVRHRLSRARRALAGTHRDAHRHAGRHHRRGHRPHARPASGARLGVLRRRGRLRHHARRRHLLRLPVHPVRAAHHERARAGLPERLHRHRRARAGRPSPASSAGRS